MKKYPLINQTEEMDCGVASLSTILLFYQKNYSLAYLKVIMEYNDNIGTNFFQLFCTAKKLNFKAKAVYVDNINEITKRILPCIAQIQITSEITHFIVIYKLKFGQLLVADPAHNLKYIKKSQFALTFTGNLLLFSSQN